MQSAEFRTLKENIDGLKAVFLNFQKRDDSDYTDQERMLCRAFIAFSHAEIEYYLESLALRILNNAVQKWNQNGEAGRVVVALLSFRRQQSTSVPDDPKQPGKKNTYQTILMGAVASQKLVISNNNGIKPVNFANIFTPLGLLEVDVEETLLIQLGNTGSRRGDLVHKSTDVSLPLVRDPFSDEEKDVYLLLGELEKFDTHVETLNL